MSNYLLYLMDTPVKQYQKEPKNQFLSNDEQETLWLFLLSYWLFISLIFIGILPFNLDFWFIFVSTMVSYICGRYGYTWEYTGSFFLGIMLSLYYSVVPFVLFDFLFVVLPTAFFAVMYKNVEGKVEW